MVYPDAPRWSECAGVGGNADRVHPAGGKDQGGLSQRAAPPLQKRTNAGAVFDGILAEGMPDVVDILEEIQMLSLNI